MARIESKITVKVSNAKELQKLNSNIKKAIQLNKELNDVLKDIQKTKLAITTEFGKSSKLKTATNDNSASDKENWIDGSEFKLGILDKSKKLPKNKLRALNLNSDSLSEYGVIFYSHDKKDNKVPLATMSLKADDLKWATLLDKEYSRILTGLAKECDLSPDLYVWISGTEFKLKKPEELDIKRIHEIFNGQKNDIAQ